MNTHTRPQTHLGKGDVVGDLFVEACRMLEPLEVEARHQRKRLHCQLLRRLLVTERRGRGDVCVNPMEGGRRERGRGDVCVNQWEGEEEKEEEETSVLI